MRVRILKHLISVFGSMEPGAVHVIPGKIAESWCRAGIAEEVKTSKERTAVDAKQQYFCGHCKKRHNTGSRIGKRHLKYSS